VLTFVTFLWGDKYSGTDVAKLAAGLKRNVSQPYRFLVFTDQTRDVGGVERHQICDLLLTKYQGCFARLRLFHPEFQDALKFDDRIVSVDLDVVITGNLDPLFDRPEPFLILKGANSENPCPYNGSLWMLRPGYRPDVWTEFTLSKAAAIDWYAFPDDQSWFAHMMPNEAGWTAGPESGVYAFKKPGWPKGDDLPKDARLVAFPGWRSPEKFKHLKWVQQNWR
jgi:hypothetical protein